jgi:hypothetical protein
MRRKSRDACGATRGATCGMPWRTTCTMRPHRHYVECALATCGVRKSAQHAVEIRKQQHAEHLAAQLRASRRATCEGKGRATCGVTFEATGESYATCGATFSQLAGLVPPSLAHVFPIACAYTPSPSFACRREHIYTNGAVYSAGLLLSPVSRRLYTGCANHFSDRAEGAGFTGHLGSAKLPIFRAETTFSRGGARVQTL